MEVGNKITNQGNLIKITLDLYLFNDDGCYVAYSPALDLSGYGATEEEAKDSFSIVIEEYISYGLSKHTLVKDLREHGWKVRSFKQRKMSAPTFESLLRTNDVFRDILENKEYRKVSEPFPEVLCS
ncbi:MAG: hypothetical protein K2M83_14005 [Muribaculaceae bacterium]|nr:hypothetical protein [Muribaculaceae bacterium]